MDEHSARKPLEDGDKALPPLDVCLEKIEQCNLLEAAFLAISDPAYVTDLNGRIILWNREAERLTGYASEEIVGNPCSLFLEHESADRRKLCGNGCPQEGSCREQDKVTVSSIWSMCKDRTRVPVELTCAPIRISSGHVLGFVSVFRDISEKRQLERAREEYIATLSHDMKSPLTIMLSYAQLLGMSKFGQLSDQQREFIERIRRSGEQLNEMIGNILSISQIDSGSLAFHMSTFPATEFFQDLREMFEPIARENGVAFVVECPEGIWLNADRLKLTQVFQNLVGNSLRYTPAGGAIRIHATPEGERVAVSVADTGRGIPLAAQGQLFRKFSRVPGTKGGTGLGLYIVRNILEGHGSQVTLRSDEGAGTTFTFALPNATAPLPAQSEEPYILLVGEESDDSSLLRLELEREGFSVRFLTSETFTPEQFAAHAPRLIVLVEPEAALLSGAAFSDLKARPAPHHPPVVAFARVMQSDWGEEFDAVFPLTAGMGDVPAIVRRLCAPS